MANTGQMLLVLGSLVIFSLMLPSLNETLLYNDTTLISTNAELTAISLAQGMIAEAATKEFDAVCAGGYRPSSTSELTSSSGLGPGWWETYPDFNDIDDFNGLSLQDSTTFPSVLFNISCTVSYANPSNPDVNVSSTTWLKRLVVTVTSPYLINPASMQSVQIQMEQIFAFY